MFSSREIKEVKTMSGIDSATRFLYEIEQSWRVEPQSFEQWLAENGPSLPHPQKSPTDVRLEGREGLNKIATRLLLHDHVERIELFGSFARGDDLSTSDFDLIIVSDQETATRWMQMLLDQEADFDEEEVDTYHSMARTRFEAACTLLQIAYVSSIRPIDVFVFPPDWREDGVLTLLQAEGGHRDPKFMQNIADDAIIFDPDLGTFNWPN